MVKGAGKKKIRLTGIPKLDDANHAGSAKSKDCTLILTEGDSAKTLAMSGISVVGRDYYGVFPLKGKPLNVREASHKMVRALLYDIFHLCRVRLMQFLRLFNSFIVYLLCHSGDK